MDQEGNVEIVTTKEDVIFDRNNGVVEHWHVERLLNQNDFIKGCQVGLSPFPLQSVPLQIVSTSHGGPLIAVCVLRNPQHNATVVKNELVEMCRSHGVGVSPSPRKTAVYSSCHRINGRLSATSPGCTPASRSTGCANSSGRTESRYSNLYHICELKKRSQESPCG